MRRYPADENRTGVELDIGAIAAAMETDSKL
jgi:hypothetical protein